MSVQAVIRTGLNWWINDLSVAIEICYFEIFTELKFMNDNDLSV